MRPESACPEPRKAPETARKKGEESYLRRRTARQQRGNQNTEEEPSSNSNPRDGEGRTKKRKRDQPQIKNRTKAAKKKGTNE